MKSADPLDTFDLAIGEVIGRHVPTTFFAVVLETSNGLMPAAGELMKLSTLLIVPGVKHTMQIIRVNLCSLVLRPKRFIVLQGSHIMKAPGIL